MAGKEASFARVDSRDPLSGSAETTPDFDALERAADSIRPAWDGLSAATPSISPAAPTPASVRASHPAQPATVSSPSAADSTHRMRTQLPASAGRDDLDDLTIAKKGRTWLAPAVFVGIVIAGLAAFLASGEPAPVAPKASVPTVPTVPTVSPAAPAEVAAAAPRAVEPPAAPVATPEPTAAEPTPPVRAAPPPVATAAPIVEKAPEPPVDRLVAPRAKRREKRPVKAVVARPVMAKKQEPVRKPVAQPRPVEAMPRKGVGFVSDNPY